MNIGAGGNAITDNMVPSDEAEHEFEHWHTKKKKNIDAGMFM